jgi:hypothetical protein
MGQGGGSPRRWSNTCKDQEEGAQNQPVTVTVAGLARAGDGKEAGPKGPGTSLAVLRHLDTVLKTVDTLGKQTA